jgi:hypothetical protein
MPSDPYHNAFDEVIDLQCFDIDKHCTAGLSFIHKNGQFILAHMWLGTPGAKIPQWHTPL